MKRYKLYLLDLDGTLYLGDRLFECTKPFLDFVKSSGARYVFVSNNSSKGVQQYVEKFGRLGIETKPSDFLTSVDATIDYLKENDPGKRVYALGTKSFLSQLKAAGINATDSLEDDVEVLLMGYDTELTYKKLEDACILLGRGVKYVATNPDLVCPTEYGSVPDCGSVSIMLKNATGREPYFIGKPEPAILQLCMKKFSVSPEDTIMIGDRIYTDIASGVNAGCDTALVMSGETTREIFQKSLISPTYVLPDVSGLIV